VVAQLPLGILVQIAIPAFAGTVAMIAATMVLDETDQAEGQTWVARFRNPRLGVALRSALLAAVIASLLLLVPYLGLLLSFLLMPLVLGPPIVGQVVALEGLSLRDSIVRARELTEGIRGRIALYLLNIGVGLGILSVLLVGGSMALALDASDVVRVLIASLYQAAILGALVGFLATVEFTVYSQLRARAAVATTD
jgi:hypothetical protein